MTVDITARDEALTVAQPGTRLDRVMTALAYGYLTLPPLLFVLGWLRWYLAIPVAAVLVVSYLRCLRSESYQSAIFLLGAPGAKQQLLLLAGVVVLWFLLSGLGGYTYQNGPDHDLRNAVFRDLVACQWPLVETPRADADFLAGAPKVAYVYYLGHWLPAAAIGKVLGLRAATHALFLWSLLGGLLALYFFFRHLGTLRVGLGLLFLAFSGLDVIGYLVIQGQLPAAGQHIEWWATYFQYSSVTTTLFWVYNQTIAVWLIVMLLLNQRTARNAGYLYAMSFIVGPYSALGMLPLVLYQVIRSVRAVRQWLTFQNVAPVLLLALVCGSYYLASTNASVRTGWLFQIWPYSPEALLTLLLFWLLEFGLLLLIIGHAFKREPLFWITAGLLLFIPCFHSGICNEFAMRASIPPLLLAMVYCARYFTLPNRNRLATVGLMVLLLLGAWTPAAEVQRCLQHAAFWPMPADEYRSSTYTGAYPLMLTNENFKYYLSLEPEGSFFFKYLARK
ncbi:MAG: hypothetical protein ACYDCO_21090 [Armatimonadota bacterium]